MNVSVIIPTYNGAHKLPAIIKALSEQVYQDFELLVIVDGSTDNTNDVLRTLKDQFPKINTINQMNGGRAVVRNRGASAAKGELLIFFDDDMRPAPDCISIHVSHQSRFPGSIMTGAQLEEVTKNTADIIRFKAYLSSKWSAAFHQKSLVPLKKEEVFITAANFSIAKNTFDLLGGFDERLTDAEDYDLAVRASMKEVPLYVNLNAHAWHDDKITCRTYIKRLRQYALAHRTLFQLKPELYKENRFARTAPKGWRKLFYSIFTNSKWIIAADKGTFSTFLPMRLRFKLYDFIVTANGVYFPDKVSL